MENNITPEQEHEWTQRLRAAPRLNSMFDTFENTGSGSLGTPMAPVSPDLTLLNHDPDAFNFIESLDELSGAFDQHYVSSIPYSREEEARLGASLLRYSRLIARDKERPATVYITSGADGPVPRALAKLAGKETVETLTCSPNLSNKKEFYERGAPENAHFFLGPYFMVTPSALSRGKLTQFSDGFDVVQEDTTFQMYDRDRFFQIALVRRNLRPDGIFMLFEKLMQPDLEEYYRREQQKDQDFKSRFFNQQQIERKKGTVLTQMEQMQVTLAELVEALHKHFECAAILFNTGNFYNIAAANHPDRLLTFISNLSPPALPSYYQYHQLPQVLFGPDNFQPKFMKS